MTIKLEQTNHPYYCSDNNYYSNEASNSFDSWGEFKEDFAPENIDHDYNYVVRFDLNKYSDEDSENEDCENNYVLHLYYLQQRKGNFLPVLINNIKEEDMDEINNYLKEYSNYIKSLWSEFIN